MRRMFLRRRMAADFWRKRRLKAAGPRSRHFCMPLPESIRCIPTRCLWISLRRGLMPGTSLRSCFRKRSLCLTGNRVRRWRKPMTRFTVPGRRRERTARSSFYRIMDWWSAGMTPIRWSGRRSRFFPGLRHIWVWMTAPAVRLHSFTRWSERLKRLRVILSICRRTVICRGNTQEAGW